MKEFSIYVDQSPEALMKKFESCRLEMAPKIGMCTTTVIEPGFTCRIDYSNAYALIQAKAGNNGTGCDVTAKVFGNSFFLTPIGAAATVAILLIAVAIDWYFMQPKSFLDGMFVPTASMMYPIISMLTVPFSMHTLTRYIRENLLAESGEDAAAEGQAV